MKKSVSVNTRSFFSFLHIFLPVLFFCISGIPVFGQITIVVINADAFPDSVRNHLFIAGNFNGWDPGDVNFQCKNNNGKYALTFTPPKEIKVVEFKFTRGTWDKGEVLEDGGFKSNRIYTYSPGMVVEETIDGFEDLTDKKQKLPNPDVIQFAVYSEELKREKNIRVYLPCDYAASTKKYPVLYMLDGQNLFDDVYAFSGEWGVDECMDSVCAKGFITPIIVGIDHAGPLRLTEYSPWKLEGAYSAYGGEGDAFSDFLANSLKPKIDSLYRTEPGRESTAVAGSSMGGLMSLYIAMDHADLFSMAGIFSPAFETSSENFKYAAQFIPLQPLKFYFICGGHEDGGEMVANMEKMYQILSEKNSPFLNIRFLIDGPSTHSESFWRSEMYNAVMWFFGE